MKIIAVGDLHHGPNFDQIESAIQRENADLTVFVGDYFDQFGDHREHAYLTARWLAESLRKPARVHLMGNHDLAYAHPQYNYCPGFSEEKASAIKAALGETDWAGLALWHFQDGWLFTHAGLTAAYAPRDPSMIDEFLSHETTAAWKALSKRQPHWIWNVGSARGGDATTGGLLWCDWSREFKPVRGLNQVVGHTPGSTFRQQEAPASQNWCIDISSRTGVTQILALEDGRARIVEIYRLRRDVRPKKTETLNSKKSLGRSRSSRPESVPIRPDPHSCVSRHTRHKTGVLMSRVVRG